VGGDASEDEDRFGGDEEEASAADDKGEIQDDVFQDVLATLQVKGCSKSPRTALQGMRYFRGGCRLSNHAHTPKAASAIPWGRKSPFPTGGGTPHSRLGEDFPILDWGRNSPFPTGGGIPHSRLGEEFPIPDWGRTAYVMQSTTATALNALGYPGEAQLGARVR
jgi:hypothetical protein